MGKDKQSQVCIKHLFESGEVVTPGLITIYRGNSLCVSCFKDIREHEKRMETEQQKQYEAEKKQVDEAAAQAKLEEEKLKQLGGAPLVEATKV